LAPAANVELSGSPKVELMSTKITYLATIMVEEKVGSSKPMMIEDKGKELLGTCSQML
jgi:hypothetical protein